MICELAVAPTLAQKCSSCSHKNGVEQHNELKIGVKVEKLKLASCVFHIFPRIPVRFDQSIGTMMSVHLKLAINLRKNAHKNVMDLTLGKHSPENFCTRRVTSRFTL